jgi:hypothetical protein
MFIPPMSALQRIPDSGRTASHVQATFEMKEDAN